MKDRTSPQAPAPATLVVAVIAGLLTVALAATQPAVADARSGAATSTSAAEASDSNRPTGRFLKQPLRLPRSQ